MKVDDHVWFEIHSDESFWESGTVLAPSEWGTIWTCSPYWWVKTRDGARYFPEAKLLTDEQYSAMVLAS